MGVVWWMGLFVLNAYLLFLLSLSLSSLRLRTYTMMKILILLLKSLNRPHTSNSNHMTITRLHAAGLILPRTFINFYINCTKKNYYSNKMVDVGGVYLHCTFYSLVASINYN